MIIEVNYFFNQTNNSGVERGIEILDLPEYDYDEIMDMDKEKEIKFIQELQEILKTKFGYYSIKVSSYLEL